METAQVFSDVGGMRFAFVQSDTEDGVEMLGGGLVTGNFFPMLGLKPAAGRTLLPSDDVSPGGHYVVMLGHSHWESKYGSDPGVVGTDLRLNGRSYTIVGVAPRGYTGDIRGFDSDIYAPMMMVGQLNPGNQNELEARGNQSVFAKGRLAAGASLVTAGGVSERLTSALQSRHPDNWQESNDLVLVATDDVIMNPMIDRVLVPAAGMLVTVVALVLLIACANLASFLLAQALDRRKEIALRLASRGPATTSDSAVVDGEPRARPRSAVWPGCSWPDGCCASYRLRTCRFRFRSASTWASIPPYCSTASRSRQAQDSSSAFCRRGKPQTPTSPRSSRTRGRGVANRHASHSVASSSGPRSPSLSCSS